MFLFEKFNINNSKMDKDYESSCIGRARWVRPLAAITSWDTKQLKSHILALRPTDDTA